MAGKAETKDDNNVQKSLLFSVGLQVILKGMSFALNNWIARRSQVSYLGIVVVRFEFILTVVGVLAREGVRRAMLRLPEKETKGSWIAVAGSLLVALIASSLAAWSIPQEIVAVGEERLFYSSGMMYALAAVIESAAESPIVACMRHGRGKERMMIESGAVFLRIAVIITAMLQAESVSMAQFLNIFARGQLVYAVAVNIMYWTKTQSSLKSDLFTLPSKEFLRLATSLCGQNLYKFVLGQGDMLVVNAFASLKDQGSFAVVSNYGSLVLRLLFQPLEETSMTFFAKEKNSPAGKAYFVKMFKAIVYVAALFSCFAAFFTWPVVRFLLGRRWLEESDAVLALAAYCFLVATAIISGFLEAFVHATVDSQWMTKSRNYLLAISIVYCALAVGFIRSGGAAGLILASALNFGMRGMLNWIIVDFYLKDRGVWAKALPDWRVLGMFGVSFVVNMMTLIVFGMQKWIIRLLPAALCFAMVSFAAFKYDASLFKSFLQ